MKLYLIGGGASLTPYAIELLKKEQQKGHMLFGVNHACEYFELDYLVYLDTSLYTSNQNLIDNMGCQVFTRCARHPKRAKIITTAETFIKDDPIENGVYAGSRGLLSGIAGISIALALGYNDIYLVGYDGGEFEGHSHMHHKKHRADVYKARCDRFD